jgi:catechol 2,3-dioxygenase-like lactoylglutathione lyase family enzyme
MSYRLQRIGDSVLVTGAVLIAGALCACGVTREAAPAGTIHASVAALPPRPELERAASRSVESELSSEPLGLPAVRAVSLTVSDLDASIALFGALDFSVIDERFLTGPAFEALAGIEHAEARLARLRLGSERVDLTEFVGTPGRRIPRDAHANDAIFQHIAIVVRDMEQAFGRLHDLPGVELISPEPQTLPLSNPAAGGIRALYFRDADAHDLELIWFPPGKGRARWHARRSGVFLGIDHSAIAVADSAQSEGLYRALGLEIAGRSLNFGREQAALSGVPGARVQITGLAAEAGPGIEFLSYLEPGPGQPAPGDSAVNDLWHWEIELEVASLEAARAAIGERGGSAGPPLDIASLQLGHPRAALARDRDGHFIRLLER